MPIRLNLLAEQHAAEEERRRDPVKKVLWAGAGLSLVMVLWMISLHWQISTARAELGRQEQQLMAVEENSKEVRANRTIATEIETRLANLDRYSTNRFYSANLLNALQQVNVDNVRLVQLQTAHQYSTNTELTFKTNIVFNVPQVKSWQFWRPTPPQADLQSQVATRLGTITNQVKSLLTPAPLAIKVNMVTNRERATAQIEIKRPAISVERITLTIKARDYSNPPGRNVDEFFKTIASHPYFAALLEQDQGQGIRLRERAIQPELDQADILNPSRPYIPFTIECRYKELVRVNEQITQK
jgi:hypothetical protein